MLKWVVTRGPSGTLSHVPSPCSQNECDCNKENLAKEAKEMENNNSYTCHNFENKSGLRKYSPSQSINQCTVSDNRRPNLAAKQQDNTTPLTSRNARPGRTKMLRTRRERNRTLIKRLSATSLTNLSEIVTPASPRPSQPLDPIHRDVAEDAQLLQHILNSNRLFNEREVKTPEEPSPLENGKLCRQRAVRRKHGKVIHHHCAQDDPYDSASFFNCFVFRELAQEMLI